jgi:hypothetical protein
MGLSAISESLNNVPSRRGAIYRALTYGEFVEVIGRNELRPYGVMLLHNNDYVHKIRHNDKFILLRTLKMIGYRPPTFFHQLTQKLKWVSRLFLNHRIIFPRRGAIYRALTYGEFVEVIGRNELRPYGVMLLHNNDYIHKILHNDKFIQSQTRKMIGYRTPTFFINLPKN